jgi:hypothetical protein
MPNVHSSQAPNARATEPLVTSHVRSLPADFVSNRERVKPRDHGAALQLDREECRIPNLHERVTFCICRLLRTMDECGFPGTV